MPGPPDGTRWPRPSARSGSRSPASWPPTREGAHARDAGRGARRRDGCATPGAGRGRRGSPLVKTAMFGGDPNPGRFLQAIGAAGVAFDPAGVDVAVGGVEVVARRRDPAGRTSSPAASCTRRRDGDEGARGRRPVTVGDGPARSTARSAATCRTSTCVSTGSTRPDGRRPASADPPAHRREGPHPDRGAPLHARASREGDRREGRRRGDGPSAAREAVRRGRGAARARRHQPGHRARRRPAGDEGLAAPRHRDHVRRRAARDRRRDAGRRDDGAGRHAEHRCRVVPRHARRAGGGPERRRRRPADGAPHARRPTSGSSARSCT